MCVPISRAICRTKGAIVRGSGSQAGFQLIELMVVLVVIAVVLASAVPSFTTRNARARTEGAARDLSSRMQMARQLALTKRVPYRMVVDESNLEYYFERQENDSTWVADPDETYTVEGVDGFSATIGGSESEDEVFFETRGTIADGNAPAQFVFVSTNGDSAALSMVRTGRCTVRMSYN